ncbi:hypothetical protein [Ruegeria lacuscaerulensis]|uniref:hypothetical protein n=1 Tax=Ruegeria lacuscaerulensis TaxID=55218 RepID=UPI00147D386A|nr:hypothetical protein [Ruegeria lacuscaerulensis]
MTDSKLVAIVTALLFLMTSHGARAEITLEHLLVIDQYLSANNTQELRAYLQKNPELLLGDDELSRELRNFNEAATRGRLDFDFNDSISDPDVGRESNPAFASSLQH